MHSSPSLPFIIPFDFHSLSLNLIFIIMIEAFVHLANRVVFHPYFLAVYGVLLWQAEQWYTSRLPFREFLKRAQRNIGRSLIWVGVVVVFDDEIIRKYNTWAEQDYVEIPLYFYTAAGFFIEIIRSKIIDRIPR